VLLGWFALSVVLQRVVNMVSPDTDDKSGDD
jgi:hypothetical protein